MNPISIYKFLKSKKGREIPVREKLIHGLPLSKDELNVKGSLFLNRTKIKFLPDDLNVEGYLVLRDSQIEYLPDNLNIGKNLFLRNTPIKSLPNNLKVGLNLNLNDTQIISLPNNLKIGYNLYLSNTPLSKKYSKEEIRKIIEDKGGNVGRKIYL